MIDWKRVETLQNEIGADSFDEVVELFLEEVSESTDRLNAGLPSDSLGAELHFLKGCALNLGFTRIAELCQIGEEACAAGNPGDVDLTAILQTCEASRQTFVSDLSERISN